jgi:hypothetical protein
MPVPSTTGFEALVFLFKVTEETEQIEEGTGVGCPDAKSHSPFIVLAFRDGLVGYGERAEALYYKITLIVLLLLFNGTPRQRRCGHVLQT